MKVKVCGLSTPEQVKTCVDNNASFCGFILNYPKSHRYITYENAHKLTQVNRLKTKYVGVLVRPTVEELKKFSNLNLDYFQIYGDYDDKYLFDIKNKYKKKIIMALQITKKEDVFNYEKVKNSADIILWDSSGLEKSIAWTYDWIKSVPNNITKMIAGDITIEKVRKISDFADIIDVSGALETNKVKDINKIIKFLNETSKINHEN
mgnify:CR=1 FL=1|tara:strand:- start:831 stop:1448 length:618 start_codon:yes stop_codon:yes gene_type:complete